MGMLATNNRPLNAITLLRPRRSDNMPAKSVEITLPRRTAATMKESCSASSPDVASRYGSAPAMMPTSIP